MRELIRRLVLWLHELRRQREKARFWKRFFREGGAAQYFKAGGGIR